MYLDPNTPTCKSCTGPNCRDNILPEILLQKKLTSGYFSVFSSTKPAGREVWHPMCNVDLLCKSSGWLEFGSQIYTHIIFFQASVAMVALSTEPVQENPLEASIRMTLGQITASFTSVLLKWPSTLLWKCCKTSDWPQATKPFFGMRPSFYTTHSFGHFCNKINY